MGYKKGAPQGSCLNHNDKELLNNTMTIFERLIIKRVNGKLIVIQENNSEGYIHLDNKPDGFENW